MKESLVWFVVIGGLLRSVMAQSEGGELLLGPPEPGLQGRVKSLRVEIRRFDGRTGQWVEVSDTLFVYDPKGNLLEEQWSGVEGGSAWKSEWVYRYDAQGNMVEKTMSDAGGFVLKWVYTYNAQGKKIAGACYRAGETLESEESYIYDPQGRLTEQVRRLVDGTVWLRYVNTYDARGRLVKTSVYYGREMPTSVKIYTATGWTSETVFYKSDGNVRSRMVITCDNKVRRAEIVRYTAEGAVESRTTCTAEATHRVTRCLVSAADGSLESQEVIVRDGRGYVTEVTSYSADGVIKKQRLYRYEFDSKGNWIKKLEFQRVTNEEGSRLEPVQVTFRTISYYEGRT